MWEADAQLVGAIRRHTLSTSYLCGTYATYGQTNPAGCRCHRVAHDVLERIVLDYLKATAPKVRQLLEATETGNPGLALPVAFEFSGVMQRYAETFDKMHEFVEEHVGRDDMTRHKKAGRTFDDVYALLYERVRPRIEKAVQAKEAELDGMVEDFRGPSAKVRGRANEKMEALQAEIDNLRQQAEDLRVPWSDLMAELVGRRSERQRLESNQQKRGRTAENGSVARCD